MYIIVKFPGPWRLAFISPRLKNHTPWFKCVALSRATYYSYFRTFYTHLSGRMKFEYYIGLATSQTTCIRPTRGSLSADSLICC